MLLSVCENEHCNAHCSSTHLGVDCSTIHPSGRLYVKENTANTGVDEIGTNAVADRDCVSDDVFNGLKLPVE